MYLWVVFKTGLYISMNAVNHFFLTIWEWLCELFASIGRLFSDPRPVSETLPEAIEESDLTQRVKRRFPALVLEDGFSSDVFDALQNKISESRVLFYTHHEYPGLLCAVIAEWLTDTVPGIKISLASPNLKHSEYVRSLIDNATTHRRTVSKSKEKVEYSNGSVIRTVTHNSVRGSNTDVLLLNSPDFMQEYQLSQYMIASHVFGKTFAVATKPERIHNSYFTGFKRAGVGIDYFPPSEPAPESSSD